MAFNLRALEKGLSATLARLERYYRTISVGVALVLSGAFAFSAWNFTNDIAENEARIRFEFRAKQMAEAIGGRMVDYEQVLRGGVGLFAASTSVERGEWRQYVEHLRIEMIYPGIQAIGFVERVPVGQKARHVQRVRADGFRNYTIQPEGDRPEYAPVIYIEPFDGRNLRAFGFDMLSASGRRSTIERARDSGNAAISGKLRLTQETETDTQAGFVMFVPVYRAVMESSTVSERRAAVVGYIYGAFRANDLMRGILGKFDDIRLRVLDDVPGDDDQLLFDSRAGKPLESDSMFEMSINLPMRGRTWRLQMNSLAGFEDTVDRVTPVMVGLGSGAISLLVLAIMWSLATTRARAVNLARTMTRDLRSSREQLALAIEGSGQATFDWDVATGRVVLSKQWAIITGGGPVSLSTTATELMALVHPDDLPQVSGQIRDLMRGKLPFYHAEHRVRTPTGWRWISSRAKVVERDEIGRPMRIAGTNLDITDSKEVERLKAEFVSTVSHELRTPLTALIGSIGLLDRQVAGKLAPDAAMFLGMARQNSERLARLINDILDIEKIESGRMEFRLDAVQVGPLLERAILLNAPFAEKLGVRFELGTVDDAVVSADVDRVLQVLTNLMSNGAKFSPAGAAVTISAVVREGTVRVSVTDRGPGVPEEFRGRIFGKFAQADASDTRKKGGTGLGLSISRAIIEKLGGMMDYESVPGQGATFFFELPLHR